MAAFYNQGDQEIYKNFQYVPQEKYRLGFTAPVQGGGQDASTPSFGIPNTNAFTNSGGNGFNSSFSNNPYTAQPSGSFVTNRTSYGGYLPGTKPEPSKFQPAIDLIGKGIGMAIPGGNFLMGLAKNQSRENRLNATDNAFIDMQLANQEQSLHGGNLPNQDRYGYNKVSMFGNYADLVSKKAAAGLAKPKDKRTDFDNYFIQKEEEQEDIEDQINFNNFVRQRGLANKIRTGIKKGTINEGFNIHTDRPGTPPSGGDGGGRDDIPGFGITPQGNYTNQFEGGDPGQGQNQGGDTESQTNSQAGVGGFADYAKGGRAGYFFGGRVNYKVGGRTDAESQYGADSVGSYDSSANQSDRGQSYGGNNKPPVSNDNRVVTTDFITKNPNLTVDYTDPRNFASLYSKIGFKNLIDNDDLTVEGNVTGKLGPVTYNTNFTDQGITGGNVTGEFGPIGYNTNFTDQGITGTNLTAGNFNANISPDMQVQNIAYNNNINGINYGVNTDFDNTMFTAGVNFKNGGLASIL